MAVLAAILPEISRSASLSIEIYRVAASCKGEAVQELLSVAKSINTFSSLLKQVGTLIKEDDRLPSHAAIDTLEDVIEQFHSMLMQIRPASLAQNEEEFYRREDTQFRQGPTSMESLKYLQSHLDALRTTLSVMLQTLYTAQSIMWSKLQPTVSPQQVADAVASERTQLETIIIEQQLSILEASKLYEEVPRADARLLMETDSSQSLIAPAKQGSLSPNKLYSYLENSLAQLETSESASPTWLPAVCKVAASRAERLLLEWTSLPRFDERLRDAERDAMTQKRDTQQPMVESDSEDDSDQKERIHSDRTFIPDRPGSVQPLFTEANGIPLPARNTKYGPTAPLSPVSSPKTSRDSVVGRGMEQGLPESPRSSIGSLPVEAAAAVEAKEEDDDLDLEIPWSLCTQKYYWKYIDSKVVHSNTGQLPSIAFLERTSWTEIMASWVCKQAIQEAGYRFTQVQKDRKDGRRTKFETCFCIERPLQFLQVKQLVERTVEIYRQSKPASPPPQVRRSSFNRNKPPPPSMPRVNEMDRDRTPVPKRPAQPSFERSSSSMPFPPPPPVPLNRSNSTPQPIPIPTPRPGSRMGPNPHASNLQIPMPSPYAPQVPPGLSPAQNAYPYQMYNSPQTMYPPPPAFTNNLHPPPPGHPVTTSMPQSPMRQSHLHPKMRSCKYDDDYTTTDSDSNERDRRRQRSKSRSRYSSDRKKRSHNKSKAVGALMGVGGLTALLDGLSGL